MAHAVLMTIAHICHYAAAGLCLLSSCTYLVAHADAKHGLLAQQLLDELYRVRGCSWVSLQHRQMKTPPECIS